MRANKKTHINISQLISNLNKENRSNNTRPTSRQSFTDNPKNDHQDLCNKTFKLDKQSIYMNMKNSKKHNSNAKQNILNDIPIKRKILDYQIMDNHSQKRTIYQKSNEKRQMFENLISSEKMFIDPDRWEQFLSKAQTDQKFHRALSAFLYSYFIQNYQ